MLSSFYLRPHSPRSREYELPRAWRSSSSVQKVGNAWHKGHLPRYVVVVVAVVVVTAVVVVVVVVVVDGGGGGGGGGEKAS